MRHKVRDIQVRMANGKAIGTAELEVDTEASGSWLEIVLNRELARELIEAMEVGAVNGLTLDASIPQGSMNPMANVNRHGVGYVRPEYGSDGKAYEGSTPPRLPGQQHPHIDDFDLDSNNRTLGEEEINSRFGFHKATLEGPNATAPRHAYLRNEFKYFADMLDRVLPPGREKSLAFTALEEASMWSHKSIAQTAGPAVVE